MANYKNERCQNCQGARQTRIIAQISPNSCNRSNGNVIQNSAICPSLNFDKQSRAAPSLVSNRGQRTHFICSSQVSKMAHLRETIILALFVHNAFLTPSMKFKELLVENARWDDMEISTAPMHTEDNQRSVMLLNF